MYFLSHISKSFQDKVVLNDISLSVKAGEVIALIGENGAGKTTLVEILKGNLDADSGTVQRNGTIGYVPQHLATDSTIRKFFDQDLSQWQIELALEKVGLNIKSLNLLESKLSGGQKTRLSIAKALTTELEPNLLLLDEPTNNLDSQGLKWLRSFIRSFRGAVIFVSHDRLFINQVATKVIELKNGSLRQYGGNYDFYREQKDIELASQVTMYEQNMSERKHLEKALLAQREKGEHTHEHIKRSDGDKYQRDFFRNRVTNKLGQQAKQLEKRLQQMDDIERPQSSREYHVNLNGHANDNKLVMRTIDISKSYDNLSLKSINLEIFGKDRIHISGQNGSGKSTLLRICANLLNPDKGEVNFGNQISIGYFSQDTDGLDHTKTGLENMQVLDSKISDIFRICHSLGLTSGDLTKHVRDLSRGQQAKLSFAKLLIANHQLLILDEPTNHIDIPTRELIETALKNYQGAILVASHDTYFIDKLNITSKINLERGLK